MPIEHNLINVIILTPSEDHCNIHNKNANIFDFQFRKAIENRNFFGKRFIIQLNKWEENESSSNNY